MILVPHIRGNVLEEAESFYSLNECVNRYHIDFRTCWNLDIASYFFIQKKVQMILLSIWFDQCERTNKSQKRPIFLDKILQYIHKKKKFIPKNFFRCHYCQKCSEIDHFSRFVGNAAGNLSSLRKKKSFI